MTRLHNQAGPHRPIPSEPIRPGEVWPIRLLHDVLGWGARTRASAIRQGLPVHRWGKLAYVRSDDLIGFLTTNRSDTPASRTARSQEGASRATEEGAP
jgi:hypothetical protein